VEAVARYSGKDNMEELLEAEGELAEKSLRREREKFELEERWDELRQRREREAEGEMKETILREQVRQSCVEAAVQCSAVQCTVCRQDKLVVELDRLREEAREKVTPAVTALHCL
jgi:hypothetical protein